MITVSPSRVPDALNLKASNLKPQPSTLNPELETLIALNPKTLKP